MSGSDWIGLSGSQLPLVVALEPPPEPVAVFRSLSSLPHCLFLDSAMLHPAVGRYSFVTADPFDFWQVPSEAGDALDLMQRRLRSMRTDDVAELPPFQGGAAGLFAYDLNRSLEKLPVPRRDEFQVPSLALGLYDVVVAFDHLAKRAWIVSQGFPETTPEARRDRAMARAVEFQSHLNAGVPPRPRDSHAVRPILRGELAEQFGTEYDAELTSNFSCSGFLAAINRGLEYIRAGDVFQVNLAHRLLYPAQDDSVALYSRLRTCNPAPFSGYFDLGSYQVVSASPERFLCVRDGWIETRPIKGTRQRCWIPEADLFAADDLRESEKDLAENTMIVDLLRNDISRACDPDTVHVTQLCELEVYQYVQHLVSVVRGKMAGCCSNSDLIRTAFPGGSITGAPKIRAMEIITELEPTARGAYCGSLGYLGFNGAMDLSILIRTITAGRGWWQLPVGGGIVVQSVPAREYEETWHKARGMLEALRGAT